MEKLKLVINGEQEYLLEDDLVTIGRASDNLISFSEDPNISRYHAEIEKRGDEYWIIDLGSFNGSTINGHKFEGEKPLLDGDDLLFGGSSGMRVSLIEDEEETEEEEEEAEKKESPKPAAEGPEKKSSKMPIMLIVAALAVGLAVIFVAAAGLFYLTRKPDLASACNAQATITSPDSGETLTEATDVEIDLENGECVSAVSYQIEGKEFAKSTSPPFSVAVNPDEFPEFSDGLNRSLKVVLLDAEGKEIIQSKEITLFMETIVTETPEPKPVDDNPPPPGGPVVPTNTPSNTAQVSISDSVTMAENTIKQFSGSFQYSARNPDFLREVNRMTAEYVSKGFYARAKKYRDVINVQYIQERSLDPPLPYILAMSRSKFELQNDSNGAGIWKMQNELVASKSYNGLCQETIDAPNQRCAAIASAAYLEEIIINVFDGDFVYGIAAFGMTTQQAEAWKASLPIDPKVRGDFWNVIKSRRQREQVVRFFAAAMVAENPQKYGLRDDRPLSNLYKVYMRK